MERIKDEQWCVMTTKDRVSWLRKQASMQRKAAIVDEVVTVATISAMIVVFGLCMG